AEVQVLPEDVIVAAKVRQGKKLTAHEQNVLLKEGIANQRSGKFRLNMEKVRGLQFDTYQYVVMVQKYAHHYEVLKNNWAGLSGLRMALLADFRTFVLRDPLLLHNFLRELMVKRANLSRLSQDEAITLLKSLVN
ncbi:MAG: hypothetical protein KJ811_02245, partial [Candidatus Margulisbacteria bacterium]|nr:hypothetical protein [Candidatus Margulisiibacteriota bacterium]